MNTLNARTDRQRQQIVLAVTFLAIVFAGALFLNIMHHSSLTPDLAPFHALGEVAADQVASLLGGKGSIVIVVWDNKYFASPTSDAQLSTLSKQAKKAGLTIAGTEVVKPDSPAILGLNTLSPEQFFDVVRRHSDADAIVSFICLPPLNDTEIAQLSGRLPKCAVIAVRPEQKLKGLFQRGIIQLAILLRANPSMSGSPKSTREWFDRYYQVVRSDSELP